MAYRTLRKLVGSVGGNANTPKLPSLNLPKTTSEKTLSNDDQAETKNKNNNRKRKGFGTRFGTPEGSSAAAYDYGPAKKSGGDGESEKMGYRETYNKPTMTRYPSNPPVVLNPARNRPTVVKTRPMMQRSPSVGVGALNPMRRRRRGAY